MTEWYIKEFGNLAQISVQTLHHYDHIGLLRPSLRSQSGYRLYSEQDLLKLQQIVALKFFGFELSQIKTLLNKDEDLIGQLSIQSEHLHKQANILHQASQTIKNIIADYSEDKSIPWKTIIKSIEVYRMIEQLEKSWEGKVFNSDELKKYAEFEQQLKNRFTEKELEKIHQEWKNLVDEVNVNLQKDPESEYGMRMGKRTMDWVNHFYGKENASLRNAIWTKGFKKGQIDHVYALSLENFAWFDKAINAHYRSQVRDVLNQIEKHPDKSSLEKWKQLFMEMHGDDEGSIHKIYDMIFSDEKISESAKSWVRKTMAK